MVALTDTTRLKLVELFQGIAAMEETQVPAFLLYLRLFFLFPKHINRFLKKCLGVFTHIHKQEEEGLRVLHLRSVVCSVISLLTQDVVELFQRGAIFWNITVWTVFSSAFSVVVGLINQLVTGQLLIHWWLKWIIYSKHDTVLSEM